jgi:cardiolipin synthase
VVYRELLRKIAASRERIWITNGYFLPRPGLLRRLRAAARRGVDVRILLPRTSDVFFMPWASAMYYRSLIRAGIRVFEYLPGVLHAKTLIVDDWMTVGSSNFDYRSFLHNLEVDVVLRSEVARAHLLRQFRKDLRVSREVVYADCARRPLWQQLLGRLCLRFQYWI